MFKRKLKPEIKLNQITELTLYQISVEIELDRKNYSASLYYTDHPNSRYADNAVKKTIKLSGKSPEDIITQVSNLLKPPHNPTKPKGEKHGINK